MALNNDIVLRPRFKMDLDHSNHTILEAFEASKSSEEYFIVTRVDDHVFIKIPKADQHFWSPQLHLEIMETAPGKSTLFGLFGPNPTVWTLFMFLHFLVGTVFIGFGIWAYVNWTLEANYAIQLFMCLFMVVVWFLLYYAGRIGKATGKDQMHLLHNFMQSKLGPKQQSA